MFEIRGSVDISRPVQEAFLFLSQPENNVQWETGVVKNELTTEGPLAVGSKGRRVDKQMGTDEGAWVVTEHVPNDTLAMSFESPRYVGTAGYKVEATEEGPG